MTEHKLYVVGRDAPVSASLAQRLERTGIELKRYDSIDQFIVMFDPDASGCLIVDSPTLGGRALGLLGEVRDRRWCVPVIYVCAQPDVPSVIRALDGGASAVLVRPFSDEVLLARVEQAMARADQLREVEARRSNASARLAALTPRERQVLRLVVAGHSTKQIADDLGVSPRTVDVHRARIKKKCRAQSAMGLLAVAMESAEFRPAQDRAEARPAGPDRLHHPARAARIHRLAG